jgi:CDP-diacylglycerol--serine O-phosphatidyltransferase
MGIVLISADPPVVLFSLFLVYGLSGWVLWAWRVYTGRMPPRILREDDD